jgi:hypothetical protein
MSLGCPSSLRLCGRSPVLAGPEAPASGGRGSRQGTDHVRRGRRASHPRPSWTGYPDTGVVTGADRQRRGPARCSWTSTASQSWPPNSPREAGLDHDEEGLEPPARCWAPSNKKWREPDHGIWEIRGAAAASSPQAPGLGGGRP